MERAVRSKAQSVLGSYLPRVVVALVETLAFGPTSCKIEVGFKFYERVLLVTRDGGLILTQAGPHHVAAYTPQRKLLWSLGLDPIDCCELQNGDLAFLEGPYCVVTSNQAGSLVNRFRLSDSTLQFDQVTGFLQLLRDGKCICVVPFRRFNRVRQLRYGVVRYDSSIAKLQEDRVLTMHISAVEQIMVSPDTCLFVEPGHVWLENIEEDPDDSGSLRFSYGGDVRQCRPVDAVAWNDVVHGVEVTLNQVSLIDIRAGMIIGNWLDDVPVEHVSLLCHEERMYALVSRAFQTFLLVWHPDYGFSRVGSNDDSCRVEWNHPDYDFGRGKFTFPTGLRSWSLGSQGILLEAIVDTEKSISVVLKPQGQLN